MAAGSACLSHIPFEGVEKRLVVQFNPEHSTLNLRKWTPQAWQCVLDYAFCQIQSVKELGGATIYLLSESTLVVWDQAFLLKTCGRTTPFLALAELLRVLEGKPSLPGTHLRHTPDATSPLVSSVGQASLLSPTQLTDLMIPDAASLLAPAAEKWIARLFFSRLEFTHPQYQIWPHRSFDEEAAFLAALLPDVKSCAIPSGSYTLFFEGNGKTVPTFSSAEFLMHGILEDSCERFAGEDPARTNRSSPYPAGADRPIASWAIDVGTEAHVLDEFWFTPCGYSCNALMMPAIRSSSLLSSTVASEEGLPLARGGMAPTADSVGAMASPAQSPPNLTSPDPDIPKSPLFFDCHVSPEPTTSYASLEMGCLGHASHLSTSTLRPAQLVTPFQPQRIYATYFSTAGDLDQCDITQLPVRMDNALYRLQSKIIVHFSPSAYFLQATYERDDSFARAKLEPMRCHAASVLDSTPLWASREFSIPGLLSVAETETGSDSEASLAVTDIVDSSVSRVSLG